MIIYNFIIGIAIICLIAFFVYRYLTKNKRKKVRKQVNEKIDDYLKDKAKSKIEEKNKEKDYTYKSKEKFVSECEKYFYDVLLKNFSDYNIIPQVNLASIINKESLKFHYQSELYRNIDFGIFSKDFKILLLIEINDKTHSTNKNRQYRDIKVKDILKQANVPIITFWTNYENKESYIVEKINNILKDYKKE